jgi:hypothetical protein
MAPVLKGKSIGLKTLLKGELLIWRTKNQARDQGISRCKNLVLFLSKIWTGQNPDSHYEIKGT